MDGSFQEISKPRTIRVGCRETNKRSVTGIMQWIKLKKDLANPSYDFVNRVLKYTSYMLK